MPARFLAALLAASLVPAADYTPHSGAGPHEVQVETGQWTDAARQDRDVPWKLYLPAGVGGPLPVVVFSHGLGGSRDGAEYLGRHLASHRFAAIHIQHRGSDTEIWKEGVQAALRNARENVQAALDRFRDVPFTVDRIEAMNAQGPFSGRFDLERMGISGHSYGAITTLVAAGQRRGASGHGLAEPRFKAALAFSPSPPRNGSTAEAFADMLMPIFHVTGTADGDPYGELKPVDRQIPFRAIGDVDQYLLVLEDAVHMTFSGRDAGYTKLPRHHDLVRMASLAFWDAYLREDAAAKRWLAGGGLATELGEDGEFETKLLP